MIGWVFVGIVLIAGGALLAVQPAAAARLANSLRFVPAAPARRNAQYRVAGLVLLVLGLIALVAGLTR